MGNAFLPTRITHNRYVIVPNKNHPILREAGWFFLCLCYTVNLLNLLEAVMATITFDTLKFVRKLESAGFSIDQAEAVADAFL